MMMVYVLTTCRQLSIRMENIFSSSCNTSQSTNTLQTITH
jgi:hypothetical protein